MNDSSHPAPDYDYLLKLDHWSKKDAALIICGKDPENYPRDVQFTGNNIPNELREPYKLYKIFVAFDRYADHLHRLGDPCVYINLAYGKDWKIPDDLVVAYTRLQERYKKMSAA